MDSLLVITSLLQKSGGVTPPSPRKGRQDRTGGNKQHNPTLASSRNTHLPVAFSGFLVFRVF